MYRTVVLFHDLEDDHIYQPGDVYPHDGREVKPERINALETGNNKANRPLIRLVEETPAKEPKRRKKAVKTPETAE